MKKNLLWATGFIVALTIIFLIIFYQKNKCELFHRCGPSVRQNKLVIAEISREVELYYNDCGKFPRTKSGLDELIEDTGQCKDWGPEPYIKSDKDVWGNKIHYRLINEKQFELISYGRDGKPGGAGKDMDVVNLD